MKWELWWWWWWGLQSVVHIFITSSHVVKTQLMELVHPAAYIQIRVATPDNEQYSDSAQLGIGIDHHCPVY